MNSFKLLQLEEEKRFDAEKSRVVKAKLMKAMESFRFIGQVAEVFTSGFFNAIQLMFDDDVTTADNINSAAVELTLQQDLVGITVEEIEDLILQIRKRFRRNERILYVKRKALLLSLKFVMSDEKAAEIVAAIQAGQLQDIGIVDAKMKEFITLESVASSVESFLLEKMEKIKGRIASLLEDNRVLDAIDELAPHLNPDSGIHNQLVFLKTRYNNVLDQRQTEKISPFESEKAYNRIADEIRNLVSRMGEGDLRG